MRLTVNCGGSVRAGKTLQHTYAGTRTHIICTKESFHACGLWGILCPVRSILVLSCARRWHELNAALCGLGLSRYDILYSGGAVPWDADDAHFVGRGCHAICAPEHWCSVRTVSASSLRLTRCALHMIGGWPPYGARCLPEVPRAGQSFGSSPRAHTGGTRRSAERSHRSGYI